jgi:hypothetical protein
MDNIEKIINSRSTGGFPPIYICDEEYKKKENDDKKMRGFSKDDTKIVASLKDIMEERRTDVKPFIEL